MRKKMLIGLFIIFIILCITINCTAAVKVTDQKLNAAFQKFIESAGNESDYRVSVSNNIITLTIDGEKHTINYDLTNNPTFTVTAPVKKGMSYEEFKKNTDNLIFPLIAYIAVANIQGVEVEDATAYALFSYMAGALNGAVSSENTYIIVDDLEMSEGITIEPTEGQKIIYKSEFGNRVMEYVNSIYKDKQTITDASGINSYSLAIEKQDTTSTSCKLVSTLTVNLNANFSQLNGYADSLGGSSKKQLGDINGDNKIDTKDARLALLAYVGKEKLTTEQTKMADVNRDGKVDTKDARQILLKYVGKIENF